MLIQIILSIVISSIALLSTIVGYVLVVAKIKWENEKQFEDIKQLKEWFGKHEREIKDLQIKITSLPTDEKIDRLESQIHNIDLKMEEMMGEIKNITRIIKINKEG